MRTFLHLSSELPDESLHRLTQRLAQAQVSGDDGGRILAERDELSALAGQHVKQVHAGRVEPGEIGSAQVPLARS